MKHTQKTYWKGLEQLTNDPEFVKNSEREFPESVLGSDSSNKSGTSRRDFLKLMGFSVAAASLAACEAPVRKAIPYLNKPETIDPSIPNYYASTYAQGGDYAAVVVKTREGRPIKIEGNAISSLTKGGTTAQVQASVLSLYDDERLKAPMANGKASTWAELDATVSSGLASAGRIALVSNTIISPSYLNVIEDFKAAYPGAEHITYDPASASGQLAANEATFGTRALPHYRFDKADVVVSFGADFLGTWLNPITYTKQYSQGRKLTNKQEMSRHYQFETTMSLTGANADHRVMVKPSEEGLYVVALYNAVASLAGRSGLGNAGGVDNEQLKSAAKDLWAARGKALVVSGSNDTDVQLVVNGINDMLGSYGSTIENTASYYRKGDDAAMAAFVNGLSGYGAVIFLNCNPVYDHPQGAALKSGLANVGLTVAASERMDETAAACTYVATASNFLESWGDAEPVAGHFSFQQPAITPLYDTRQQEVSLLVWAGQPADIQYHDYVQNRWKAVLTGGDFTQLWDKALHDGVYTAGGSTDNEAAIEEGEAAPTASAASVALGSVASRIAANYKTGGTGFELALYQKIGLGTGTQANNPWLQEMPDPISKATWENYVTLSVKDANDLGVKVFESDTKNVKVTVNGTSFTLPDIVQPGQATGTVGIALGYGRSAAGVVANGRGADVFPLVNTVNGTLRYTVASGVSVEATSEKAEVAHTQTHHTYMARENVVREASLERYLTDFDSYREETDVKIAVGHGETTDPEEITLWAGHTYNNHHWGMVVDLNSCTGCGACTIACQSENNVPVVGKDEVINRREMHWMRIDRYYSSDAAPDDKSGLEDAAANPDVVFQPLMCQQCNNAPCETVCPVAATTHSTEGLNQMTYNRCIGTRYCANNCPFKVRRFNWFKYHDNKQFADVNTAMNTNSGKMVLNPDVTVRSRGVMEKCSFCAQRIQAGKLTAKKERRSMVDGDVKVACAQACPADAIVFGDMKDPKSQIREVLKAEETSVGSNGSRIVSKELRAYNVLSEINVRPNVYYLAKIRNKNVADS